MMNNIFEPLYIQSKNEKGSKLCYNSCFIATTIDTTYRLKDFVGLQH
jgi:hypothetical protein